MTSSKRVNLGFFFVNLFTPYFDDYLPMAAMLPRPGPVGVIFFLINAPGMDRFKLFDLVGYS